MKKISRRELFRLLSTGYGNGLRYLSECGEPMKYADIIAKCLVNNTCFDMQCEGDRGPYLCDAVMITGQPEYFADIVMANLKGHFEQTWNCLQMSNFLVCLYYECEDAGLQEKISGFFNELYIREIDRRSGKRFVYNGWDDGFESLCICLFELDKAYFERIVNDVGRIMLEHPGSNRFSLDWFFSHCTDGGKKTGRLRKADPECARVFTEKFNIDWGEVHEKSPTLDELLAGENGKVLSQSSIVQWVRFRRAVRKAEDDELLRLAEAAMAEQDESKKCGMLAAFEERPFPLGPGVVMEIYREGSEDIRERCLEIMVQFPGEKSSAFALGEAECRENPAAVRSAGLAAYVQAAEFVDIDILAPLAEEIDSHEKKWNKNTLLHHLNLSFQNRSDKCSRRYERLRRYFYNNLRCTRCRLDFVEFMVRARDDCGDILAECLLDCSLDTRKYAARVLKRRSGKAAGDNSGR